MTHPPPADGPGSILWLASYPKSGNTWLRALLTNYCHPDEQPASINALIGPRIANQRDWFDERVGLSSSDMTPEELQRHLPLFHRLLAEELPRPTFVKTHQAYVETGAGAALFPREAAAGAVYIVRNPLDVAVSFAHHDNRGIGQTVRSMNDPAAILEGKTDGIHPSFPDTLLSWSGHVRSWLEQDAIPVHALRYEDLHADAAAALGAVVRFAGLDCEADLVARAAGQSRFELLRDQEARDGFNEMQPSARSFFRAGVVGGWRGRLSANRVRRLVGAHRTVMARLGYLECVPEELRNEVK